MRRVVVTGLGIVSSLGNSQAEVVDSLRQGRSGIAFNPEYRDAGLRCQLSGRVVADIDSIDRKHRRFMGAAAAYAYLAMRDAVADAGLVLCRPVPVAPRRLVIGLVENILFLSPKVVRAEAVEVLVVPFYDGAVVTGRKLYAATPVSQSPRYIAACMRILACRDVAVNLHRVGAAVDGLDFDAHVGKGNRLAHLVVGKDGRQEADGELDLVADVHDKVRFGRRVALGCLVGKVGAGMAAHPVVRLSVDHDEALPALDTLAVVHVRFAAAVRMPMDTHVQKRGHWPGRTPLSPPSVRPLSQTLRYGDRTARGAAGGRAGEKVDLASTWPATASKAAMATCQKFMVQSAFEVL